MGSVNAATVTPLSIVDGDIAVGAGISASKLTVQQVVRTNFNLSSAATPVTTTVVVYNARSACTLRDFTALLVDTGTSTNIDFDLKKNGSSVLSAAINFTHSDTDNTPKAGTISGTSLVAGDVVTMVCTVTSSTGALGPSAQLIFNETYV